METIKERRLRLWKARQEAEGYDVSKVKTLEEAEHFFDKKPAAPAPDTAGTPTPDTAGTPASDTAGTPAPSDQAEGAETSEEEVTQDEQCDIDPIDLPQ